MEAPYKQVLLAPAFACESDRAHRCYSYQTREMLETRAAAGGGLLCANPFCMSYHAVLSFGSDASPPTESVRPTLFSELVKALAAQREYDSAHGRCTRTEGGPTPQQHADLEEAARQLAVAEERFEQALVRFIHDTPEARVA